MGFFGNKKEKAPVEPAKKAAESWEDNLASALPKTASFFDELRTEAFVNQNDTLSYLEFWVAMRVDVASDKWRIMHYMAYDLDEADGNFKSEVVNKNGDISFVEAVGRLAQIDNMVKDLGYKPVEATLERYPADKFPELKRLFFDIEYYKDAANIEGIAFDAIGNPHRRVDGKVFASATFKRSEVAKSLQAGEKARDNPKVAAKIEGGILSDIFCSASERNASLDNILKIGQTLSCLDTFVSQVGAFYLSVQYALDKNDKFDKIQGMTDDERKDLFAKSSAMTRKTKDLLEAIPALLQQADAQLEQAKAIGVHTEPFKKFVAECELYLYLLDASQKLKKLEPSLSSVGGTDIQLIASIKQSVDASQKKFMDLGGAADRVDRLKAWVANPKKEPVPQWLTGFIDRYYDQRRKIMQKIQQRQAQPAAVATLPAKVKPPIAE